MPSSIIIVVLDVEDDSIEITPSTPILSIASAMRSPTNSSFPAAMEATAWGRREGRPMECSVFPC